MDEFNQLLAELESEEEEVPKTCDWVYNYCTCRRKGILENK